MVAFLRESATTVTDEIQSLYAGRSVVFDYIPDTAIAITVKSSAKHRGAASTAYELGDRIVEGNKVLRLPRLALQSCAKANFHRHNRCNCY